MALSANTCPPPGPLVLDTRHRLYSRVLWAVPTDGNTDSVICRRNNIRLLPYSSTPQPDVSRYGRSVYYPSNSTFMYTFDGPKIPNVCTVVAAGYRKTAGGTNCIPVSTVGTNGIAFAFEQYLDTQKLGVTHFGVANYTSSLPYAAFAQSVVWAHNGSVDCKLFSVNGYDLISTGTVKSYSPGIAIGGPFRNSPGVSPSESSVAVVLVFNGLLTDGECWDLVYDPWMLFRPHRAVVAFSLSEAAMATIFRRSNTLQNRIGTRMPV